MQFQVEDTHGHEVGRVTKRWAGVIKELFTEADCFGIKCKSPDNGPKWCP